RLIFIILLTIQSFHYLFISMRILLITKAFYPTISPRSFRATELAKELSRQGHQVTVVTLYDPKQIGFAKEYDIQFSYLPNLKWKEISIAGNPLVSKIKRVLKRSLQLIAEYPDVELVKLVKNYI